MGTHETGGSDPDGSGDSAEGSNDTDQLPKTGTTVTGLILAALLLVAGGWALRRRKTV